MTTPNIPTNGGGSAPQIVNAIQQQNMYLSSFFYYNYALSQAEIFRVYGRGPNAVTGWLSNFGIGTWKFQSPLVRVTNDQIVSTSNDYTPSY